MYKKICLYIGLIFLALCVTAACDEEDLLQKDAGTEVLLFSENPSVTEAENGMETVALPNGETKLPVLYVHVCGAVNAPGVYELAVGSRIYEAIDAADGFDEEADREAVNLVEELTDGEQIRIPFMGEAEFNAGGGLIDINRADAETLCEIPGIGESRARAIIEYREAQGGFTSVEELMKVPGIKEGIYARISPYVECR